MIKCFLDYLAREFPGLPDFRPLDQTDIWPSAFKRDQDYLRKVIASLEKEIEQVHETVRSNTQRKEGKGYSKNIAANVLGYIDQNPD